MELPEQAWNDAFVQLYDEVYNGIRPDRDFTYVVQGKEGIWFIFDSLRADQASRPLGKDGTSIGAHLNHAKYYLSQMNAAARDEAEPSDWEGSWAKVEFNDAEWKALRADFQEEFDEGRHHFTKAPIPSEYVIHALGQAVHAAYHLGACRAMMRLVVD